MRDERAKLKEGATGKSRPPQNTLSARFRAWVEEQLERAQPGYLFPSDARCGEMFGMSASTAKRILCRYRDRGRVCRSPGKGTFVPTTPRPAQPAHRNVDSAASVADIIRGHVQNGLFKQDELLPPLKQLSLKWKVSRSTLVRSLRNLAAEGLIAKIGRHWHVGGVDGPLRPAERRQVLAFHPEDTPFATLFTQSPYAQAFRTMEHHLLKNGTRLTYASVADLPRRAKGWLRTARPPHGLFFAHLAQGRHDALRPLLQRLRATARIRPPEILIAGAPVKNKLRAATYCHYGHVNTERHRVLARWIVEHGYTRVHLWFDPHRARDGGFFRFAKLWVELRHLNETARITVHMPGPGRQSRDAFMERLFSSQPREQIAGILEKYTADGAAGLAKDIRLYRGKLDLARRVRPNEAWVTICDACALRVRNTVLSQRRKPRNVSVISVENDPAFLTEGLSACIVDEYTMGYQMAQALVDHTRVGRSRAGYLKVPGLMLERETTPVV
ncbi:MAG: GntR family transcriptional regulator [Kiritimatiellae bacterium]|nr:GntR family transcriptional regulator [Kiritimatiellia bacterium]